MWSFRVLSAFFVTFAVILIAGIPQEGLRWVFATLAVVVIWLLAVLGSRERRAEHQRTGDQAKHDTLNAIETLYASDRLDSSRDDADQD